VSSQPVLVRSYSGATTGPASLYGGRDDLLNSIYTANTRGSGDTGSHHQVPDLGQTETALRRCSIDIRISMQSRRSQHPVAQLPPVAEFQFSHVLEAISPDIRDALDAISEICARSRLSLADEYGAHLPPLGEIRDAHGQSIGHLELRGRNAGLFVRTTGLADSALSVVQEASSSSGSEGGRRSAYGSLRSVLSKGRRKKTPDTSAAPKDALDARGLGTSWAVRRGGKDAIVLVGRPTPSRCVSTDLALEASPKRAPEALSPSSSLPTQEAHKASWIPWGRQRTSTASEQNDGADRVTAEALLKNILVPSAGTVEGMR